MQFFYKLKSNPLKAFLFNPNNFAVLGRVVFCAVSFVVIAFHFQKAKCADKRDQADQWAFEFFDVHVDTF